MLRLSVLLLLLLLLCQRTPAEETVPPYDFKTLEQSALSAVSPCRSSEPPRAAPALSVVLPPDRGSVPPAEHPVAPERLQKELCPGDALLARNNGCAATAALRVFGRFGRLG